MGCLLPIQGHLTALSYQYRLAIICFWILLIISFNLMYDSICHLRWYRISFPISIRWLGGFTFAFLNSTSLHLSYKKVGGLLVINKSKISVSFINYYPVNHLPFWAHPKQQTNKLFMPVWLRYCAPVFILFVETLNIIYKSGPPRKRVPSIFNCAKKKLLWAMFTCNSTSFLTFDYF